MPTYNSITVTQDLIDFFWKNVSKEDNGCWIWTGHTDFQGYGRLRRFSAHRFSWVLANQQQIPDGKPLRHLCNNTSCVNPDHLVPGTPQENSQDVVANRDNLRRQRRETHSRLIEELRQRMPWKKNL